MNILNIDLIELLLVYIEHSFFMESINFQFHSLFAETTPDAYLKTRCVAMTTRYRSLYGIEIRYFVSLLSEEEICVCSFWLKKHYFPIKSKLDCARCSGIFNCYIENVIIEIKFHSKVISIKVTKFLHDNIKLWRQLSISGWHNSLITVIYLVV